MNKLALMLLATLAIAAPAAAKDLVVTLTDQEQQNVAVVPLILDQCVAGATIRGEFASCKTLHGFLSALALKVRDAQTAASNVPADIPKPPTD